MRCATCKHWIEGDAWDAESSGVKRCSRIEPMWIVEGKAPAQLDGKYHWEDPVLDAKYVAAIDAAFNEAKAVVQDGSSYRAELLTRPDFGCVLWTEKP